MADKEVGPACVAGRLMDIIQKKLTTGVFSNAKADGTKTPDTTLELNVTTAEAAVVKAIDELLAKDKEDDAKRKYLLEGGRRRRSASKKASKKASKAKAPKAAKKASKKRTKRSSKK